MKRSNRMTGAEAMVRMLQAHGVTHMFGLCGDTTLPFYDALSRLESDSEPMEVLRQVGGTELVAIAGGMVEARMRSIPVLLDGYIATSPALALHAIDPDLVANCRAGHCSAEPGHQRVLDHLSLSPLLTLDMRLGEASGAMAAVPLIKMACALVNEVPTFTEWFGSDG